MKRYRITIELAIILDHNGIKKIGDLRRVDRNGIHDFNAFKFSEIKLDKTRYDGLNFGIGEWYHRSSGAAILEILGPVHSKRELKKALKLLKILS